MLLSVPEVSSVTWNKEIKLVSQNLFSGTLRRGRATATGLLSVPVHVSSHLHWELSHYLGCNY